MNKPSHTELTISELSLQISRLSISLAQAKAIIMLKNEELKEKDRIIEDLSKQEG